MFSKFVETRRRGIGSAIGGPEHSLPPDHPFRPACDAGLEFVCIFGHDAVLTSVPFRVQTHRLGAEGRDESANQ